MVGQDAAEVEAVAARVAKVLSKTVELREPTPVPKAGDDPARGQHLTGPMLAELRAALPRLKVTKLAGGAAAAAPGRAAVLSVRRLREAFYRRKADPAKQGARVVKLSLYALGRVRGLPDCGERSCAMSATGALADIDMKPEKYCAACWRRLNTGAFRI